MPKTYFVFIALFISINSFSQSLDFSELGSTPSLCRIYSYQNGGGVVYAEANGGAMPYTYLWEELSTGETSTNSTWGGRNPGDYRITITDDDGTEISETIFLDSINVEAKFHAFSDDLTEVPGGYVGFAPDTIGFINLSTNFSSPEFPEDPIFFWNFNAPDPSWFLVSSLATQYKGYYHGGEFDACLVAMNRNGCKDTACATVGLFGSLIGLEEGQETNNVELIPLPHKKEIQIGSNDVHQPFNLSIYTVSGKMILHKRIDQSTAQLSFNFPEGIYFYEVINSEGVRFDSGKFNY